MVATTYVAVGCFGSDTQLDATDNNSCTANRAQATVAAELRCLKWVKKLQKELGVAIFPQT